MAISKLLFSTILFVCLSRECGSAAPAKLIPSDRQNVDENKIRHGKPLDSINQFPFMVSVWQNDHKLCTATIISQSYILCAGHCFLDEDVKNITILAGTVDATLEAGNGVQRHVIKSEVYSKDVFGKDLAIAKLNEPFNFHNKNLQPIELSCSKTAFTNKSDAFIAGWGRITDWSVPKILQGANVSTWPADEERCNGIMETEICAFGEDGANVCFGDSGGPLLIRNGKSGWKQIGITSRGNSVCELNGFFSMVHLYCEWITQKTEGEVPHSE